MYSIPQIYIYICLLAVIVSITKSYLYKYKNTKKVVGIHPRVDRINDIIYYNMVIWKKL